MRFTNSRMPAALLLAAVALHGQQGRISKPVINGYTVGDDYFLANYSQLLDYWNQVAKQSDRIKLEEIGKTAEGRPIMMAIVTAPANFKKLARYKEISQKLGRAEALTDAQAHALAAEGKTVVWIDGGLHANEVIPAQALFTETYELLTRVDPETLRILNDDVLLLAPINPDGMELVSNWYMRNSDPKQRTMNGLPRLYQKYVGHDNNRDSYIANQPETEAVNRQMYIEWIPQIMYNQHQAGPAGSVLFFSPFRDPFNYNQDPLVPIGIDLVSAAVHTRFLAEGKPGAVMRSNAPYSTWFNGGDRTTTGFHNQIGLLAEIIGNPTPMSIPMVSTKLLPAADQPAPIGPRQEWHQRQSIDYLVSSDWAILDIASRFREEFLFRIYRAGKNSIERGSQDYWTLTPKKIAAVEAANAKESGGRAAEGGRGGGDGEGSFNRGTILPSKYWAQLHTLEARDPRGYILSSAQPDFPTATRFIRALQKAGVVVHRATAPFAVAGRQYPAGSYVIKAAQAFRPHLRDMLEPQDHPNDFEFPGGPPKPPYDITGYTLAYQMGVDVSRVLDGFDGPFEKIDGLAKVQPGKINTTPAPVGYLLSHTFNDAFPATTNLVQSGEDVYWLKKEFASGGKTYPAGTVYIAAKPTTSAALEKLATQYGISFDAVSARPSGDAFQLKPTRVALWDRYGGSMESGHIRWLFEQEYPVRFELVYPPTLNAGNLRSKFDVLILPDGAVPGGAGRGGRGGGGGAQNVPAEYRAQVGALTLQETGPQLRKFVEEGGTIVTIGGSTSLAQYLGLPVTSALTETANDGTVRRLPNTKFYVPGSVLETKVDNTLPVAYGLPEKVDVFFANSPAFRLLPDAAQKRTRSVADYPSAEPLRSGWAWGQQYLNGATAIVEANVGEGKVFLFGPEITFRGQPHGTFKFLFNAIQLAGSRNVTLQ